MIYEASTFAIILFIVFVVIVLGLSFYFARKTKSANSYFAAGGTIHWAVNGVLDVESSNMSGPLLAKAFGIGLFSIISAIAFATVLGTVSGLIVASSGAIAHYFIDKFLGKQLTDKKKYLQEKLLHFQLE